MEKEIIYFTAEVFPCMHGFEEYALVSIYRWDGFNWIWDNHKATTEETLQRYPLDKFQWVSI